MLFLSGVAWLGLAGAPDERGFWPVLLGAITLGFALAHDRNAYAEAVLGGMTQRIVMVMIMAWLLAGVLGSVMSASGFVQALVWVAGEAGVTGGGYTATAFIIAAAVSTATGTSLGTMVVCAPLLYPAGGPLGAEAVWLAGAIIGGATLGDNISPVSDTTIASATTQDADIGGVVKSRLRYALPAAGVAVIGFLVAGGTADPNVAASGPAVGAAGIPAALTMLLAPLGVVALLLRGRHLLEGLLFGIVAAVGLAMILGLVAPRDVVAIDADNFIARGLILEGMERGIGVSIFTMLLMGLVGGVEASGTLDRIVDYAKSRSRTPRAAEIWAVGAVSAAVILTTHSVVAILVVGRFARETGTSFGIGAYRRANILDMTVCTYPFLFPFFIPTILMASLTGSAEAFGMPRLAPWEVGVANLHSWMLLLIVLTVVATGWARGTLARKA